MHDSDWIPVAAASVPDVCGQWSDLPGGHIVARPGRMQYLQLRRAGTRGLHSDRVRPQAAGPATAATTTGCVPAGVCVQRPVLRPGNSVSDASRVTTSIRCHLRLRRRESPSG